MPPEPRISSELATFLESGLAIVVATRDGDLQPDGAIAWAARIHDDGTALTLFMHDEAARDMLRNLEGHPEIAIDFDRPTSHRACQVKGRYLSSRPAGTDEQRLVQAQMDGFATDLEAIGYPRAMTAGWMIWPCTALDVRVTQLFEQTPGPGTGGPLS